MKEMHKAHELAEHDEHEHHHGEHCEHERHHDHDCCGHHHHDEYEHHHEHTHACGCGCCDEDEEHHNPKIMVVRLVLGVILAAAGLIMRANGISGIILAAPFIVSYLILGGDVLLTAVKNIFRGKVFDENFLMSIATLGAFYLGDYLEGCAVMLFYQVGEMISHNATEKSEASISALMDIRPDTVRIVIGDSVTTAPCSDVHTGAIISVAAGERVAFDGVILNGGANFDTSSLTGESLPRRISEGENVLSGMICLDKTVNIRVTKEFGDSTLSRILELAENAQDKKSSAERFITSFARVYTPLVVLAAALVAIVPSLLGFLTPEVWVTRALTFLVISCPCALVVSVPLTFFAGIGRGSTRGILIKNGLALENLAKVKTAAFDKTGTLTTGEPILTEIRANGEKARLLEYAALAECDSTHPIAAAIKKAYAKEPDRSRIGDVAEVPARGVSAVIDGITVLVGSRKLLTENGIDAPDAGKSAVYVAADGKYFGYIGVGDNIKPNAKAVISELCAIGVSTMLLSGDSKENVAKAARKVGIDNAYGELMPQDKLSRLEALTDTLFVGDGINDAPALAAATVGAAMGAAGSDAAIESADLVIMGDDLAHIPEAIRLSRAVMRIVHQNVTFSIGIKVGIMVLSFFGIGGMWPAIFADVGVCVITVMNALRAFRIK